MPSCIPRGGTPGGHAYNVVNYEDKNHYCRLSRRQALRIFRDREIYADLETMPRVSHRAIVGPSKGKENPMSRIIENEARMSTGTVTLRGILRYGLEDGICWGRYVAIDP